MDPITSMHTFVMLLVSMLLLSALQSVRVALKGEPGWEGSLTLAVYAVGGYVLYLAVLLLSFVLSQVHLFSW